MAKQKPTWARIPSDSTNFQKTLDSKKGFSRCHDATGTTLKTPTLKSECGAESCCHCLLPACLLYWLDHYIIQSCVPCIDTDYTKTMEIMWDIVWKSLSRKKRKRYMRNIPLQANMSSKRMNSFQDSLKTKQEVMPPSVAWWSHCHFKASSGQYNNAVMTQSSSDQYFSTWKDTAGNKHLVSLIRIRLSKDFYIVDFRL